MGLLSDTPPVRAPKPSKFVRLYEAMDADDQAKIRAWDANPGISFQAMCDELNDKGFEISYAALCRGLAELRENQWEA